MKFTAYMKVILIGAVAASATVSAETEHDNDVYIQATGVTSCNFEVTNYSITEDQPYSGVSAYMEDNQCKITVKAGRKGSDEVADWFYAQVDTGNAVACDSSGPMPDELNFAVEGVLTLERGGETVMCDNVILAQGHYTGSNNWWLGGEDFGSLAIPYIGPLFRQCDNDTRRGRSFVIATPQQPCVNHFSMGVR